MKWGTWEVGRQAAVGTVAAVVLPAQTAVAALITQQAALVSTWRADSAHGRTTDATANGTANTDPQNTAAHFDTRIHILHRDHHGLMSAIYHKDSPSL